MKATNYEDTMAAIEGLGLEVAQDRSWVWVLTDLAPPHPKCTCEECLRRAKLREAIKEIGFRFSFKPHLVGGKPARWAHNCGVFRPFRKGNKNKQGGANNGGRQNKPEETETEPDFSEAEAFFNQ